MFTIQDSFFKEEEKADFLVPEKMKRAWAAELKTLYEIDKLCKKYNIRYFADWGTLLGAVRHKGFIPWDDDIDLCMPRPDYNKFLEVSKELGEPYRVKSIYTENNFSQFHTVVSNSREKELIWDEGRMRDFFGCPFIIGIDIDPIDYVPRDEDTKKFLNLVYYMGYSLSKDYDSNPNSDDFKALLEQFKLRTGVELDIDDPDFKSKVMIATDRVAQLCTEDAADVVVYYPQTAYSNYPCYIPKAYYENLVLLDFENITVPAPKEYDKVLRLMFGDSYMTPRIAPVHGYPFYKTQEEYFKYLGIDI